MIWWILGFACIGMVIAAVVIIIYLNMREGKAQAYVKEHGSPTFAWLIMANNNLFEDGSMDYPGFVLISPDEETTNDEEFMTDLIERISELKEADDDDVETEDEEIVAGLVSDESYVEGKRDRLPKGFAKGRKVYIAHLWIVRDHLPRKRLTKNTKKIPCLIIWDEPDTMIITRPFNKKNRRDRDDDDAED